MRRIWSSTVIIAIVSVLTCANGKAQPVPSEYQDLYNSMQISVAAFAQTLTPVPPGARPQVAFSAHVGSANSVLGLRLLDSNHLTGVNLELDGMKAIGNSAISLSIDYPTLDSAFDPFGGRAADYLSFYKSVVASARSRGLKVIIETGPLFSDPMISQVPVKPFYQSLTLEAYKAGRATHAVLIAQQLSPDYLSVIQEPDTEATQTGKAELGTPDVSSAMLSQILTAYRNAGLHIPIGAGVGSWLANWDAFIRPFAATSVDFIDLHVYPVNRDYLVHAQDIVVMAHAAGKKVGMSETWLNKVRDSELATLSPGQIFARDDYSFWMPLDSYFLKTMIDFSLQQHFEFLAGFQGGDFRGYVDYSPETATLDPASLNRATNAIQVQNMQNGTFTNVGRDWATFVLPVADTLAPLAVGSITATVYPTSVLLVWPTATDNVGVAGYTVLRNGSPIGQTALTTWYDTGLAEGVNFTYAVAAFDVAGNVAPRKEKTVQTLDATPPTMPGAFSITLTGTNKIDLRWTPSTDNVKVASYWVSRGLDGAAPTAIANLSATATSASYSNVQSSTRLCYKVVAMDTAGRASTPTATLCVTTPDTTAPTVPTGVTATAVSAHLVNVAWNASTDKIGVTVYKVYRSEKRGSMNLFNAAVAGTTFADTSTVASVLYSYRISACDAAGNCSAQSAAASATPSLR